MSSNNSVEILDNEPYEFCEIDMYFDRSERCGINGLCADTKNTMERTLFEGRNFNAS